MAISQALACSCRFATAQEAWQSAPIIFIGHITQIDNTIHNRKWTVKDGLTRGFTTQKSTLFVDEPLKGTKSGDTFVTREGSGEGDCAYIFREKDEQEQWLFYVYPANASTIVYLGCTRTRKLSNARDDLLFIRALPASEKRTRISGTVVLQRSSAITAPSEPLSNIAITISNDKGTHEVTTDSSGVFELTGLPTDDYLIRIAVPESDALYFSYLIGRSTPFASLALWQQPAPIRLPGQGSVEVHFSLVPSELLKQLRRSRNRQPDEFAHPL